MKSEEKSPMLAVTGARDYVGYPNKRYQIRRKKYKREETFD